MSGQGESMRTSTRQGPPVAEVSELTIRIPTQTDGREAWVHALTDVSLSLRAASVTALVGESGSGKSVLGLSLMGMLPVGTRAKGTASVTGLDMNTATESSRRAKRGRVIALVSQSAATFLTPSRTVGDQLVETIRELESRHTAQELFTRVDLDPVSLRAYPHELSGGMAQRAAIAFALVGNPQVIVADEPTASLDPELSGHVLHLLRRAADGGAAVLLITHDLRSLLHSVVADQVAVMYAGRIVEYGPAEQVLRDPSDIYTQALLRALPEGGLHPIPGTPPSLTDLPEGVTFADRLVGGAT